MKPIFKTINQNFKNKRKYIKDSDDEEDVNIPLLKSNLAESMFNIPNKQKFLNFLHKKKFLNAFDYNEYIDSKFRPIKANTYTFPCLQPNLTNILDVDQNKLLPIFKNPYYTNLMRHYKFLQHFNYGSICSYITLFPLLLDLNMLIYFINSYNIEGNNGVFSRIDDLLNNFRKNCKQVLSTRLYNEVDLRLRIVGQKETKWGEKYNVYRGLSCDTIIEIIQELGLSLCVWRVSNINPSRFKFKILGDSNSPYYLADMSDGHMEVNQRFDQPYFMSYTSEFSKLSPRLKKHATHINEMPIELQPITNEFIIKQKKRMRSERKCQNYYPPITYYQAMKDQDRLDEPEVIDILSSQLDKLWEDQYCFGIVLDEEIGMNRRNNNNNNNNGNRNPVRPLIRRMRNRIRRNNRRMRRRVNRRIRRLNRRIMNIDNKLSDKNIIYTKPPRFQLGSAHQLYNNYSKGVYNYLLSLIKPELAVNGKFIAKQPAFINIPTSNVCFKEQINIKLDSSNNFYMFWVPNYLSTEYSLQNHLADIDGYDKTYRNYSHLYYTDGTTAFNNWFLHTSYLPKINLSKYRLVSAKCVLQYNGNIMNQQGQFHSCAIYNDLPVFIGRASIQREEISMSRTNMEALLGDDFNLPSFCDIELVRNGLWNKYINITTNSRSLENIALPTDPTDHTFFPMSHYYAKEPPKITEGTTSSVDQYYSYAKSSDGGHLSYLYTCQNMSRDNGYVTVIIYYNFEIIPDQSTAPFLRSKKSEEENKIYNIVKNSGLVEKLQEMVSNKPKIEIDKNTLANMIKQAFLEVNN